MITVVQRHAGGARPERIQRDVHQDSVDPGPTLPHREDAVDLDPAYDRLRLEPAGEGDEVPDRLPGEHLVARGPANLSLDGHPGAHHRDEDSVAILELDVRGGPAGQQVVIEIHRVHQPAAAPDLHPAKAARGAGPTRLVQGIEGRADRTNLVGPRPLDIPDQVHLIATQLAQRELEPDGGFRTPGDTGEDAAEPGIETVLELAERKPAHLHLAHVRDHHEPFARHLEVVRLLHAARQNEDELITGTEPVPRPDGTERRGLELVAGAFEEGHPEDGESALADAVEGHGVGQQAVQHGQNAVTGDPLLPQAVGKESQQAVRNGCDPESVDRLQHPAAGLTLRHLPVAPHGAEIRIGEAGVVAHGLESRPHLRGCEPRSAQALHDLFLADVPSQSRLGLPPDRGGVGLLGGRSRRCGSRRGDRRDYQ